MSTDKRKDDKEQPANAEPKHRYMEWLKQQLELDRSEGIGVFQSLREQRERKERMRTEQPISTLFLYSAGAAQPNPTPRHFAAAKAVLLDAEEADNENPEYTQNKNVLRDLAAKLVDSETALWKRAGTLNWQDKLDNAFGYKRDLTVEHQEPTEDFPLTSETGEYRQEYDCTPDEAEAFFRELAGANETDVDMLPLTRHLVDHLEAIGAKGKYLAEQIAEDARTAWEQDGGNIWELYSKTLPPTPGVVELPILFRFYLARALWFDVVKPPLERRRRMGTSAIVVEVMERALAISAPGTIARADGLIERSGIEPPIISGVGMEVPQIQSWNDLTKLRFDRPEFWYTLGALVEDVFDRELQGLYRPNHIHFPDGWKMIPEWAATVLEIPIPKSNKAQGEYKEAIRAMAVVRMMGEIEGNLLTYQYHHKNRELFVTAGAALSPGFIHTLPPSNMLSKQQRGQLRRLQPHTKPADMGMFRGTSPVPGLRLGHILVRQMVNNPDEIVKSGGILIQEIDLHALTAEAGLPVSRRNYETLDNWTRDTDHYPAFLEKVDDRIYTLADNERYQDARHFIEVASKQILDARRRKRNQRNREQAERDRQKIKPKT